MTVQGLAGGATVAGVGSASRRGRPRPWDRARWGPSEVPTRGGRRGGPRAVVVAVAGSDAASGLEEVQRGGEGRAESSSFSSSSSLASSIAVSPRGPPAVRESHGEGDGVRGALARWGGAGNRAVAEVAASEVGPPASAASDPIRRLYARRIKRRVVAGFDWLALELEHDVIPTIEVRANDPVPHVLMHAPLPVAYVGAGLFVFTLLSAFLGGEADGRRRRMKDLATGRDASLSETEARELAELVERDMRNLPPGFQLDEATGRVIAEGWLRDKGAESVEWFNNLLKKAWTIYRQQWEALIVVALQPTLDALELPAFVERIEVTELILGPNPILLRNVTPLISPKIYDTQFEARLRYSGQTSSVLTVRLRAGPLRVGVPVVVSDVDLDLKLWVGLTLEAAPSGRDRDTPFRAKTLSLALVEMPFVSVDIRPLYSVSLFSLPGLGSFLDTLIKKTVPALFVLPKSIDIDLRGDVKPGTSQEELKRKADEGKAQRLAWLKGAEGRRRVLSGAVSALQLAEEATWATAEASTSLNVDNPTTPLTTFKDLERFNADLRSGVKSARKPPTYVGILGLSLYGGRDLAISSRTRAMSDPLVKLTCGVPGPTYKQTSKRDSSTSARGAPGFPVWNEYFEFLVTDEDMRKIDEATGMPHVLRLDVRDVPSTFREKIGTAEIQLNTIPQGQRVERWVDLTDEEGKDAGELRIAILFNIFVGDKRTKICDLADAVPESEAPDPSAASAFASAPPTKAANGALPSAPANPLQAFEQFLKAEGDLTRVDIATSLWVLVAAMAVILALDRAAVNSL